MGGQSITARLRNAVVEGWNAAFAGLLDVAVFLAQVAPTMLLWGLALLVPYRVFRRRQAR